MKVLQVIRTAYRATIEEQDDTVVWITRAMRGAGADFDVLLRDDAVNYVVRNQDASGLTFGEWRQSQPPRLANDLASLIEKGVAVWFVEEDASERGLDGVSRVSGPAAIPRSRLPGLMSRYDQVWQW